MQFSSFALATFCASIVHAQSTTVIDDFEAALIGDSAFDLFLSLVEGIPADRVSEFSSLLTSNHTLAIPKYYLLFLHSRSSLTTFLPGMVLGDPSGIIPLLSYHFVRLPVSHTSVASSANHIIIPTALTDFSTVFLEPDQSQVLVLSKELDGTIHVLNQPTDVVLTPQDDMVILDDTYTWSTTSDMLVVPTTFSKTMPSSNISTFTEIASAVGIVDALETLSGLTLFVPQDEAFSSVESTLRHLNSLELASVLSGHVVNSTLYSPQLTAGVTQANFAGQMLSTDGITVSLEGGNTANILTSDVLLQNGVVHIIDNVLLPDIVKSAPVSSLSVGPWVVASLALAMGGILAVVIACCRVRGARSMSPSGWKFESTSYIRLT
ncbi:Fasciclin-domain-containing protein [Leucogyrophana mollusca]|uniref:Fasciclin-domain-containing protein n=1 Tax=Leucogyrophana mollusca TaxID=85980 RepID=A0ACB8BV37_9AGAM|nr:Fasciclin-domain-containing protein [Leucogyrophana mollusca]